MEGGRDPHLSVDDLTAFFENRLRPSEDFGYVHNPLWEGGGAGGGGSITAAAPSALAEDGGAGGGTTAAPSVPAATDAASPPKPPARVRADAAVGAGPESQGLVTLSSGFLKRKGTTGLKLWAKYFCVLYRKAAAGGLLCDALVFYKSDKVGY